MSSLPTAPPSLLLSGVGGSWFRRGSGFGRLHVLGSPRVPISLSPLFPDLPQGGWGREECRPSGPGPVWSVGDFRLSVSEPRSGLSRGGRRQRGKMHPTLVFDCVPSVLPFGRFGCRTTTLLRLPAVGAVLLDPGEVGGQGKTRLAWSKIVETEVESRTALTVRFSNVYSTFT